MAFPATKFDIHITGLHQHVELVPVTKVSTNPTRLPRHTVPIGLPPVLPNQQEQLEEYLTHPEKLSIHDYERAQRFWPREADASSLYHIDVCPVDTTIVVDRDPTTGKLRGFKEEHVPDTGSTVKNSLSLHRPPGPPEQGVRGSSTNYPFWPGGLDEPVIEKLKSGVTAQLDLDKDLLTCAPGLEKGISFPTKKVATILKKETEESTVFNLRDILTAADDIVFGEEDEEKDKEKDEVSKEETKVTTAADRTQEVEDLVKISDVQADVVVLKDVPEVTKEYEFAVKVDVKAPVDDFYKRIPKMAYEWPFELDNFQKQSILRLESHENVFVAAHTSAGKTVIAEYAIALSMKHMTKTVYTSPIKALSNQKFRDFKITFEDVGLITGDVQIRPEASCLIMTTEILRSMLYKGSDVIRDLEFVIFDEVHYINDEERGVVWEEVLIMLPQHITIILLSATVPNTMEFADWVGRTKRRKVYVVSTPKRPVPLEHYLYTGNSNKTSNELFLILDSHKKFLISGYNKAVDAKAARTKKSQQNFGPKGARYYGDPKQEKNIWISVIEMLRKKDKLPVVAFTFSRKRIDQNAILMESVDLTTEAEKAKVHMFFQRCVTRLKGSDRNLPQVAQMAHLLKRGIGVHHSGVLPILKEVVEMLFQQGYVKVLFATETFAMGVNMPARTVVFDMIRKHDGKEMRALLPGEYIQMAGRAGRRGLDTTGTVLLLAKGDVPDQAELQLMMLGQPTRLESQFRLTYSMILNLLRVQQLRVEDMMKRSFCEFHNQRDAGKRQQLLEVIREQMQDMPQVVDYSGDLQQYYEACDAYYKLKVELQEVLLSHPAAVKSLSANRVIVVESEKHKNVLGLILYVGMASSRNRSFSTLVLCDKDPPKASDDYWEEAGQTTEQEEDGENSLPRPILQRTLFLPEGQCGQEVVELSMKDIGAITTKQLKANCDIIMEDWRKRQIPRFRNDPPGQSTTQATQELLRLSEGNPSGLPTLDAVNDLNIRDLDLVEKFKKLKAMENSFGEYKCIHDPSFKQNFASIKKHMKLKEEYENCQYMLSDESLKFIPDYQEKIKLLRDLNYIDDNKVVQLKGRVACEISNHELVITELVFQNILTQLEPNEIAALLSATVFQQRNCSEPNISPTLKKAQESFLAIAYQFRMEDDFNFGLMEVVFEWARGMPFSDITELTDVQEGIIVRCIQRLDEVLKDVKNSAMVIGDPVLKQKVEESSTLIKRDIVFAASLYTQ